MQVKVNPSSSRCRMRWRSDHLKVNLTAPPEDGKANQMLIGMLADEFDLQNSQLDIISGESGEFKTVLMKDLDRESLVRKLNDMKG